MPANFKNLIRVGTITAIFDEKGTVQINFDDKDDVVVEYPLLSLEYNMPKLKDTVWCLCLGNGVESGLCLGKAYDAETNPPPVNDKEIYHKPLIDNEKAYFEYNNKTETLTLKAKHIVCDCIDAKSTGELGDKIRTMSGDRLIFNPHKHSPDGLPPITQM